MAAPNSHFQVVNAILELGNMRFTNRKYNEEELDDEQEGSDDGNAGINDDEDEGSEEEDGFDAFPSGGSGGSSSGNGTEDQHAHATIDTSKATNRRRLERAAMLLGRHGIGTGRRAAGCVQIAPHCTCLVALIDFVAVVA
jgi:hypothetical protein